jgi:hypothetical protein
LSGSSLTEFTGEAGHVIPGKTGNCKFKVIAYDACFLNVASEAAHARRDVNLRRLADSDLFGCSGAKHGQGRTLKESEQGLPDEAIACCVGMAITQAVLTVREEPLRQRIRCNSFLARANST